MEHRKLPNNFQALSVKTASFHSPNSLWTEVRVQGTHPPRRSNHTAAIFDNRMLVIGGQDLREGLVGGFWVLNIDETEVEAERWTEIPRTDDSPPPLSRHSSVQYQNQVFIFGGMDDVQERNDLYIFDMNTLHWSVRPTSNPRCPPPIDSHSASLYLDEGLGWMIVFGGFVSGSRSNLMFTLNLMNFTWKQANPCSALLPCPRSDHTTVVVGHLLILFGGTDDEGNKLADLWKCDLRTYAWVEVAAGGQVPTGRSGHTAVMYAGVMVVFGGVTVQSRETNDMFSYDFSLNTWARIQFETQVEDPVSAVQLDEYHKSAKKKPPTSPMRGGDSPSEIRSIVSRKLLYSGPTTPTFGRIAGKVPHARDGHSAVVYGDKMYIFGGDRSQMPFNDVYVYALNETSVRTPLTTI